jgi:uncharacterized protein YjbJ (UPF0337 family)
MNKDQIKGSATHLRGKMQSKLGKVFGSARHTVKGRVLQEEGRARKTYGDARQAMEEAEEASRLR